MMLLSVRCFFIILACFSWCAHAQVSIYDYVEQGRGSVLGLKAECIQRIKDIPRKDLDLPELRAKTIALKDLNVGTHFFHYTKAYALKSLLKFDVPDRLQAQEEIERDGGLVSIMEHSLQATSLMEAGFYMAANPYTSSYYGTLQVEFKWDPETRVLDTQEFKPSEVIRKVALFKLAYAACQGIFVTAALQESGVDMLYYLKGYEWFVVLDTSMVKETAVLSPVDGVLDVTKQMVLAGRLADIRGVTKIIEGLFLLDKDSFKQVAEIVLREGSAQDVGVIFNSLLSFPDEWSKWEGKDEAIRLTLIERPNEFFLLPEVAGPLGKYLCPKRSGQGNKISISDMAKNSHGDEKIKIQSLEKDLCGKSR